VTIAVAHRGEPVGHRENTLPSFLAAVSQGADMVELDCRVTKDERVVVLHDATLERLWHLDRAVTELTFEQVRGLDVDGYYVPGLGEVLTAVSVPVMVDMDDPALALNALAEVVAAGALERCVFAGNLKGLELVRHERTDARLALTWTGRKRPSDTLLDDLRPEFFNPRWDLLTPDALTKMHGAGIGVSTWTVDEHATMASLAQLGVDAIITNRIGLLVELLSERGHGPVGPVQDS
jgi:glycerophosphoryl diester phosphodiesterase